MRLTGILSTMHYNATESMVWMKQIGKTLVKRNLNSLAIWMIFESQAMASAHLRHVPLLPPEAGRIVARNGDTPFSAPLSCSTLHPRRPSLHHPPQLPSLFYSLIYISVMFFRAPPSSHTHTQKCCVFKEIRRYSSLKINNRSFGDP